MTQNATPGAGDKITAELERLYEERSDLPLQAALRNVLHLCSGEMAFADPRTLMWYIKRGIAKELGLDEDEVEF